MRLLLTRGTGARRPVARSARRWLHASGQRPPVQGNPGSAWRVRLTGQRRLRQPGSCPSGTETTTVVSVAAIEFEEHELAAQVPDLAAGGAWTRVSLRWRRDPLTGASARILTGV